MGNGGKQTWKRVLGESREDISPSLPNPAPSPFFLAHFSLCFPNYLKACYRLSTSFIARFLWYIFNFSVEHFWRFVIDQRGNGFGSTNFSTPSRLRNCHSFSFLVFFLLFFLFQFLSYFLDVFFTSLLSVTHSPPTSTCFTQEVTDILFCPRPFVSLFRVLGLRKKYGLLFGLKDFALIDFLMSWKL